MGMAASQARFLGLTARKTNVEYEGQQINQQRTALGNQTANYYNQMLGMKVPVPPAIDDYTKTIYTFEDGSLKNTITSLIAQPGGLYTVSYLRQWQDDFAVVSATPSIIVRNTDPGSFTEVAAGAALPVVLPETDASAAAAAGSVITLGGVDYTYNGTDWVDAATNPMPALPTAATAAAGDSYTIFNPVTGVTTTTTFSGAAAPFDRTDISIDADGKTTTVFTPGDATADTVTTTTDADGMRTVTTTPADASIPPTTVTTIPNTYMIGAKELRLLGSPLTPAQVLADPYYSSLSDGTGAMTDKLTALLLSEQEQMGQLDAAYGPSNLGWAVRYIQNTSTGAYEPQFYNLDVITSPNTIYDPVTAQSQSHIPAYKVGSQQKNEEIKGVRARLEQDATGRIINITLNADQPDAVTYALTTNTIADQARYDDAMNQYEYDKYQYDQDINNINSKIAIIQSQDRNLELRLKQLDTEQNAIQTEMDAVTKVIEKNVESTFKTFG